MQSGMQAVHPITAAKRDQLREQMQPLIDELLIAEAWVVDCGVNIEDANESSDQMTEEQQRRVMRFLTAKKAFFDRQEEQYTVVAQYLAAIEALPRTVYDACVQSATFQLDYENAASNCLDATAQWRELDLISSRTRVAVVERLVAGGMAPTRADKEYSGDPEYTQLKDKIAAALTRKERAEIERDVTLEKLRTAREILRGLVQVSEARAGRPTIVLDRAANERQQAAPGFDANGVRAQELGGDGAAGA